MKECLGPGYYFPGDIKVGVVKKPLEKKWRSVTKDGIEKDRLKHATSANKKDTIEGKITNTIEADSKVTANKGSSIFISSTTRDVPPPPVPGPGEYNTDYQHRF